MLSQVEAIFAGCQVGGCLAEIEPVIVERSFVPNDLERAVLVRFVLAEIVGQCVSEKLRPNLATKLLETFIRPGRPIVRGWG